MNCPHCRQDLSSTEFCNDCREAPRAGVRSIPTTQDTALQTFTREQLGRKLPMLKNLRRMLRMVLAFALLFPLVGPRVEAGPQRATTPIVIKEQGSFFVGGETIFTARGNGGTPTDASNPGHATINQMYVNFQIPAEEKHKLPIVMMHGGGHEGKVYETTPDGREGWRTYFLRHGFAVYNVNAVNRGSSSYDITDIVLAKQGEKPITAIPLIDRYSHELAWRQFRIGPSLGVPFPTSQFPVEAFAQYTAQLVPSFRDAIETGRNVAALVALFDRIGPVILLTWSQSGHFGFLAAVKRPDLVKAIVSLEPSGISRPGGVSAFLTHADLKVLATIPILIQVGDFDPDRIVSTHNFARSLGPNAGVLVLPDEGIFGNGHVVMVERNNLQVADLIIGRLETMLNKPPDHHDQTDENDRRSSP